MALTITAGDLKWSVMLKRPTTVRNTQGGKEASFEEVVAVRAMIDETNAYLQGTIPALLHTDTVYFRYAEDRKDIDETWLLNYDGLDRKVHSVEKIGREKNRFLKVICKARG